MLKINVLKVFLNRLRDRGWKNLNVRGFTGNETHVFVKGQRTIVVIEQINIDASVDILSLVNDYFYELMNQIKRNDTNIELFLPGGGDIQLPDFFRQFCEENNIHYHFIGLDNYQNYANFL
jgi:hypothetical protein